MTVTDRLRTIVWTMTAMLLGAAIAAVLLSAWRAEAAPGDEDSTFVPVANCRLFDFRPAPDSVGPKSTPLGPGEGNVHTQQVTGANGNCTIPNDAVGVSMNVTIVNPTAQSNLRVFPADVATPLASNLNWLPGQSPTPNKVDVKLSAGGAIKLFNQNGTVNVVADVVGYYTNSTLTDIDERLSALEANGGLSGTPGPQGPQGEQGDPGPAGPPGSSDPALLARIEALRGDIELLKLKVAALETKTASMTTLNVNGRPTVRFSGVNLQVVDGTGDTECGITGFESCNGRGNLIVGYNEDLFTPAIRSGSHNLVVGVEHTYTSYAGTVLGGANAITAGQASVTGGNRNTASGVSSSVTGGQDNTASASNASVTGGSDNTASGFTASVSGGEANTASGFAASVSGGLSNISNSQWASVSGGSSNTASGFSASVSGGEENTADGTDASVSGGDSNNATGDQSSIQGGFNNTASGTRASISGGSTNTASGTDDTVAGGDNVSCNVAGARVCGDGANGPL